MEIAGFINNTYPTSVSESNGLPVAFQTALDHSIDSITIYPVGSQMTQIDLSGDAATVVSATPALLVGIYVDVALSAHTVAISSDGVTLKTLAASTPVGFINCCNHEFAEDITVTPNAASTGTISVYYIPLGA